ncbi:hypothetical protein BKE38_14905 [Pseudoroseomonas deserti]|uniref:Uncharacterized protein n=1 Tax=Teichococcus deserti TaxID=1817963 RepID=A0A1V2H0K4_9PROT|nr:hypothetical protein [Pseudoroseomonas deserti]ONG52210.1 hypothetical protein BKE38_14905 [Pseudoroseomonas deserti]
MDSLPVDPPPGVATPAAALGSSIAGTGALGLTAWALLQAWQAWRGWRQERRASQAARDARLEAEITRLTALREAELRLIAAERLRWAEDLAAARDARLAAEAERDLAIAQARRQREACLGLLRELGPVLSASLAAPAESPRRLARRQG